MPTFGASYTTFVRNRKFKRFSAQKQVISKKKKVFTEIETDFLAEIGNSNRFSAQKQVISKNKTKRSLPKLRRIFQPISGIQTVLPPESEATPSQLSHQIPSGGAAF